jgi:anti-sigma regulatory factor (Ser/Thr protein kinase)
VSLLTHQAVLYEGTDEFLGATLPFLREGIAAGDPMIAVVHSENAAALREALGPEISGFELVESQNWYHSPGVSLSGFVGFAAAHPEARRVRMIGEPIWPVGWKAGVAEWAHYESVFNVVARDSPISALCPYHVGRLPDSILEHARHTHPELRTVCGVEGSDGFIDPEEYCSRLADRAVRPGARVRRFPLTSDLAALREAVANEAVDAGVAPGRLAPFLLAVHQVAINALAHGGGVASVRTWIGDETFVCEICDKGPGLSETLAGYLPPDPTSERGRGLWLTRQVCDLVEVQSRGGETR